MALFSFDIFVANFTYTFILDFLIHLTPVYVLIAASVVAFHNEKIGGWIFIGLAWLFLLVTSGKASFSAITFMSGFCLLIGTLFLISKK